jgi:DNA-binding transcriptional LysR family regulator
MLDAVTLDQLRTFIAAADQGSFSGAGRKLRRAQSVISKTLANLEGQFGVRLFDRAHRRPVLTSQGQVLLAHARTVVAMSICSRPKPSTWLADSRPNWPWSSRSCFRWRR